MLSKVKCGFRKDHSTLDHLVRLETFAKKAFARKRQVLAVFFDLKKAYDTTWKYEILKDLLDLDFRGHTDWGADRATFPKLYRTLVWSKLDYGTVVYGSAKKHVLRALDPKHHQGLRIALGAFGTSSIKCLYADAGEPSLEHRCTKLAFNYAPVQCNPKISTQCSQWIPAHEGIRGNENVDKLAKAALNRTSCSRKLTCWSDLKPKVNAYFHTVWQENWDAEGASKLHEVLPNLGEDLNKRSVVGRKREMVMCSLRVGHTWLT
ncbi:RNA-directed DNA polymerase from mobile element jockey [Plakobranchus ocellatus]|uniref:RNA-directed DNA polymerase from mobile element jockey n=1 Tax=Plakobranchus ocellatus TaxID=259542 RepID=A0AAV3ZPY8_9GAST|nr:RNA-directed DNA polymerase from mobile element jockey [Plakobranchus ocellatus]